METPSSALRNAHRLAVAGVIILVLFEFLPSVLEWFATPRWIGAVLYGIPLLLFLPFLAPTRPKRYAWLCFVVLVYFCGGVLTAFTWPAEGSVSGMIVMALTTEIFIASMFATRWSGQFMNRQFLKQEKTDPMQPTQT